MVIRLPFLKKMAVAVASVFAAYLLFSWFVLPGILQSRAEQYVAEKNGHRLTLDRPTFNPFNLKLQVSNLRLADPAGKPLFAFRALTIDLSASSLFRRAFVFDSIHLDGPQATVALLRDGQFNWSRLIEALKEPEGEAAPQNSPLPRMAIQKFILSGGQLDFADERTGYSARITPVELELNDISTLPNDTDRYTISARTTSGARVLWQGRAMLNPLSITGSLNIENLELARFAPYLKDALLVAAPVGMASLSTDYRIANTDRFDFFLQNLAAKVTDLRFNVGSRTGPAISVSTIEAKNGRFDLAGQKLGLGTLTLHESKIDLPRPSGASVQLLQLGALTLDDAQVDMAGQRLTLGHIALSDGQLKAARNAKGRIDVVDALRAASWPTRSAKLGTETAAVPWRFHVDTLQLAGFSASLRDESVTPAADLALNDIGLRVEGISDNLSTPLPVHASLRARDGGSLEAAGRIVPADPSATLHLKLDGLILKPAQPYITSAANLLLLSGRLATEGDATYGKRGARYKGGFALSNLRLVETGSKEEFLAWKSLASRDLDLAPAKLDIGRLDIDRLYTRLIINADKSLNITNILRQPGLASPAPASAPAAAASVSATSDLIPAAAATSEKKPSPFRVNIDRIRIRKGEMDYADYSLILPFAARIQKLRGSITGVSSLPGTLGQVELEGQVDDYGIARAIGQIDLFNATDFTDIKVTFGNVEMTRLTPYSSTFAGRKIDSGKLSLNLEYKIKKRQLEGDNQIIMDKLTLGERVESSQAVDLPLDLAIAILEDSEGRVDLGLPVSGSLDDPQFSYGSTVWKAIVALFQKIITSPFRALAALFGGGEKIENAYFDAGVARLSPPEQEKMIRLAGVLNKRPRLAMTVHGVYADTDRIALQDLQLRRAVVAEMGEPVEEGKDPGLLATGSPKVQAALERLFSDRISGAELAALKEGFRKANPGELEQGMGGKIISRLSGLFRKQRTLNEDEIQQLKGADFYAVLFRRLRDREPVSDAQLESLGKARGENTYAALKAAGAPVPRVALAAPEKVDSDAQGVPVKLDLGAASEPTASAPALSASPAGKDPAQHP